MTKRDTKRPVDLVSSHDDDDDNDGPSLFSDDEPTGLEMLHSSTGLGRIVTVIKFIDIIFIASLTFPLSRGVRNCWGRLTFHPQRFFVGVINIVH